MADQTINQLTEETTPASGDFVPLWKTASGVTRKVSRANLIGATLTGGGTIATGGNTLTVPATGTASLLGVAQTYSALKTFSAGISFGDETLNVYDEGTWTPVLTLATPGSSSVTYTVQTGYYVRIGKLVWALGIVVINTFTLGTGSGIVQISLPVAVSSLGDGWGAAYLSGPAFSAAPNAIVSQAVSSTTIARFVGLRDNNIPMTLQASGLSSGDDLRFNVVYMAA